MAGLVLTLVVCAGCGSVQKAETQADDSPKAPTLSVDSSAPTIPAGSLSQTVAAGAVLKLKLRGVVDSVGTRPTFAQADVTDDVLGPDGKTAIPAGSVAILAIRQIGRKGPISQIDLGLYGLIVGGRQIGTTNGESDAASISFSEDAGKGTLHTSVHLYSGYRFELKLDHAINLH